MKRKQSYEVKGTQTRSNEQKLNFTCLQQSVVWKLLKPVVDRLLRSFLEVWVDDDGLLERELDTT